MYIEEVLPHLRTGGFIRRESWFENMYIGLMVTDIETVETSLCTFKNDELVANTVEDFDSEDIMAKDWFIYDE